MADDEQVFVNAIEQSEEEPLWDYCVRKMKVIRELTAGKKVLFVLDDFICKLLSVANRGF